jgi:hypothetical protein
MFAERHIFNWFDIVNFINVGKSHRRNEEYHIVIREFYGFHKTCTKCGKENRSLTKS